MATATTRQHGHRLGGLFRKKGSVSVAPEPESSGPELPEQLFPSPSFIRPKSSRMMAREEITSVRTSPSRRALSLPDQHAPTRVSFAHGQRPSYASTTIIGTLSPLSSSPSVPLMQRRDASVPGLKDFQFPQRAQAIHAGELTPKSLASSSISPCEVPLPPSGRRIDSIDERIIIVPPGIDTPPASDPEDTFSAGYRFANKQLPPLPDDMPTPSASPDMVPIPDDRLSNPRLSEMLNSTLYSDIERTLDNVMPRSNLRKAKSHSNLTSTRTSIYSGPGSAILREPTFHDFLDLSDDDIAEAHVDPQQPIGPPPTLPPTPPPTATTSFALAGRSRGPSTVTLPPPFTSRPATAGAFEAARIAARYNFDLVYVVNLWPEGTSDPLLTPTRSGTGNSLTGRLLAAYGLSTVKSPFCISTAVHSKILQGDGWIEYRNEEAQDDEFARGYACAFHTGRYDHEHRRPSVDTTTASLSAAAKKTQREAIDRGIVFAAYRKPSEEGTTTSFVGCTKGELESIRQDAEALVEMLIDIHAANRLRQPHSANFLHSDETGPMPGQRPEIP